VEEIADWEAKSALEVENTIISFVLGVRGSSPAVEHHYSTVRSRRKWFATSL
jgi:hypothetical protein